MRKIIVSIIVISCLLATSTISVNAYNVDEEILSEYSMPINLNQLEETLSGYSLPTGLNKLESGDYIEPVYLKKWCGDFDFTQGFKSVVLDDYLYVIGIVFDIEEEHAVNYHTIILKFYMK